MDLLQDKRAEGSGALYGAELIEEEKKKKKVSLGLRAVFQEIKPISLVKLFDRKPFCGLYSIPLFPHALSLCLRTTL